MPQVVEYLKSRNPVNSNSYLIVKSDEFGNDEFVSYELR